MKLRKVFTLVFIRNDSEILLGLKKRGFGYNQWNGFGGKVEPKEAVLDAALRELHEECCLTVHREDLKQIGHLEFTIEGDPVMMDVRVFVASKYDGTPTETEEMAPKWFRCDQMPFDNMWPDNKFWFPYVLKGINFSGKFHYQGFDKILHYSIDELESMEDFYSSSRCNTTSSLLIP